MSKHLFSLVLVAAMFVPTMATASDTWDETDAVAFDDDDLFGEDDLVRGNTPADDKKKKGKKTVETGPKFDFDEPVEGFDLEDEFDEDFEDEPPELLGNFEDDLEPIEDFDMRKTRSAPAAGPGPITLDLAGKQPFADNYPLTVVAVERDAVVVELPVLVSRSRVGVENAFSIVADVFVGDSKVGSIQQSVEPASLAEFGPSFVFLKVLAPVVDGSGEIRVVVKKADANGSGAKELFSRTTPYSLR
jgi:hypothetical protein